MNISTIEFIVNVISFFIACLLVVPITGAFRSWVAEKMGDDTSTLLGYQTLNPFTHLSLIGVFLLLFTSCVWGKHVPVNYFNIRGPFAIPKRIAALFSDAFLNIIIALIFLTILIAWFDPFIIKIVQVMIFSKNISHLHLTYYYPSYSSLSISIGFIMAATVALSTWLAVLKFLFNSFVVGIQFFFKEPDAMPDNDSLMFFVLPIIGMIFFYGPLLFIVTNSISYAGYAIAYFLQSVQCF